MALALLFSVHAGHYRFLLIDGSITGDSSPANLLAGIAPTPFQYRVLVPWLVHGALATHLVAARDALALFDIVEFVAIVALGLAFRRYVSFFIPDRRLSAVLALSIYFVLPFVYKDTVFYPGDLPSALFFTLGLILIYRQNWTWYYPLFAIATLNRETSLFLVAVFVFGAAQSWRKTGLHVAAQAAIWIAIKLTLRTLYSGNPSHGNGLYEDHYIFNRIFLHDPRIVGVYLSSWGFTWIPVVVWYRRITEPFIRHTLWVVPLFMAAMFKVAVLSETRVYGEMTPIVLSAFLVILVDLVRTAYGNQTSSDDRVGGPGADRLLNPPQ